LWLYLRTTGSFSTALGHTGIGTMPIYTVLKNKTKIHT
jgi:hypothetical protein